MGRCRGSRPCDSSTGPPSCRRTAGGRPRRHAGCCQLGPHVITHGPAGDLAGRQVGDSRQPDRVVPEAENPCLRRFRAIGWSCDCRSCMAGTAGLPEPGSRSGASDAPYARGSPMGRSRDATATRHGRSSRRRARGTQDATCQVQACCSIKPTSLSASPRKMPIAFSSTQHSMRTRSSSRRSLAISAARSDGDATGPAGKEATNVPSRERGAAPFRTARHCLSIEGWIPSSAAICICSRPLLSNSPPT